LVVPVIGPRPAKLIIVTADNFPAATRVATETWAINGSDAMPSLRAFDVADLLGRDARLVVQASPAPLAKSNLGIDRPQTAPDRLAAEPIARAALQSYRNDFTYFPQVFTLTLVLLGFALAAAYGLAPPAGARLYRYHGRHDPCLGR
jgi:hypothetical protein